MKKLQFLGLDSGIELWLPSSQSLAKGKLNGPITTINVVIVMSLEKLSFSINSNEMPVGEKKPLNQYQIEIWK